MLPPAEASTALLQRTVHRKETEYNSRHQAMPGLATKQTTVLHLYYHSAEHADQPHKQPNKYLHNQHLMRTSMQTNPAYCHISMQHWYADQPRLSSLAG
jgi:hypothetical protein